MRYLGSKTLLLDCIFRIASEYRSFGCFCDPFGGIGTVGSYMKSKGYSVVSGDVLRFAHFFQVAKIQNNALPDFSHILESTCFQELENLETYIDHLEIGQGWFIEEYSLKRHFFTEQNASHIQACINQIWSWRQEGLISENEYAVLIASLIQSMDKVANTAGTYYAYLKHWYRKAEQPFRFRFLHPTIGAEPCSAIYADANDLVKAVNADILYLDPPYNERNYGSYYYLPELIARGEIPIPHGKSGVFSYSDTNSRYNRQKEAGEAFEELIHSCNSGCIIFHYTDDGLIPSDQIRKILTPLGRLNEYYFDTKGYNTIPNGKKSRHHIYRVIR